MTRRGAPRAIHLDPTGIWLYALNQKGDNIVQFAVDQETGELTPTGNVAEVPTPVSLVFTTGGKWLGHWPRAA